MRQMATDEPKGHGELLLQCLSVAVQRGKKASVLRTVELEASRLDAVFDL